VRQACDIIAGGQVPQFGPMAHIDFLRSRLRETTEQCLCGRRAGFSDAYTVCENISRDWLLAELYVVSDPVRFPVTGKTTPGAGVSATFPDNFHFIYEKLSGVRQQFLSPGEQRVTVL